MRFCSSRMVSCADTAVSAHETIREEQKRMNDLVMLVGE